MPELRAQRTLVKSPPELWAQVSDPVSLARHLGEFGEIRITRVVPEQTVAWEGERASGTVELSSSGWGTKVTLVARLAEDADPASQRESAAVEAPRSGTRPADAFELINSIAREPLPHTEQPLPADEAGPDRNAPVDPAPVEPPALLDAQHENLDPPGGERFEEPYEDAEVTVDQEHSHELDAWFSQSPGPTDAAGDPSAWPAAAAAAAVTGARPGFFARLFGRRRGATSHLTQLPNTPGPTEHEDPVSPAPAPDPEVAPTEADAAWAGHAIAATEPAEAGRAEPEVESTEPAEAAWTEQEVAPTEPEPVPEAAGTEPVPGHEEPELAGDHVEPLDHARAEAVLTAVLDDLGAARHRPFSRG
jgi:hypothetical protein